ncbi:MAG: polyhydroxybutyrate depolymerase [Pseudomonadota bacterium]
MIRHAFAASALSTLAALGLFASFSIAKDPVAHADVVNSPCGDGVACAVGDRAYHAVLPDGFDGAEPLPVLIHFHGWGRTGTNVINNEKISGASRKNGVLLLAPDGLGKSWSFWRAPSRDVPFVEAMIADAEKRWPIDRSRIFVSGFSYGGAMAWRLACEKGGDYAAFLPIAGSLWNFEELQDCTAPVNVRHVHGLKDTVMDLPRGADGDPLYAASPWVMRNQCGSSPDLDDTSGIYRMSVWTSCESGKSVRLDLHEGGHIIPKGWLDEQLKRLLEDTASL